MDEKKIVNDLAGRRRQLNISQRALGERIGISRNHIGRIERHELSPTLGAITRMAEAFDMDLELKEKPSED